MNSPQTQNFFTDKETGDRVLIHPFEQDRNILNPHGFVDMQPLYEKFIDLFNQAEKQNFTANFEDNRNFLNISCNYQLQNQLHTSISLVEVTYGVIRKIPNRNSAEPIVNEQPYGSLAFAFYRKSKNVSVLLTHDGNKNAILPPTFLRSISLNGFLDLPLVEFEQNPIMTLV